MQSIHHPTLERKALEEETAFAIFWVMALAFLVGIGAFLLLQRLGMPLPTTLGTTLTCITASLIALILIGRTMNSQSFFFANRSSGPFVVGVSGTMDWVSGAFWVVFLSAGAGAQIMLITAVMMGLLLFSSVFASAFQKSGVATLAGFFAWQSRSQWVGLAVLIVTVSLLSALIVAEFQVALASTNILSNLSDQTNTWLLLGLAALVCLAGGWLSLLLVNGVLALWMVLALLVPAVVTGLFPAVLRSDLVLPQDETQLPLLTNLSDMDVFLPLSFAGQTGFLDLLLMVGVLTCGLAAMPHILSRTALSAKARHTTESQGWTALLLFLIFIATPLSFGLISSSGDVTSVELLSTNPFLQSLPHLALLFAAFNAMCACVLTLSSALVRAFRRSRNQDPSEQSMFTTRLLMIAIFAGLASASVEQLPSVPLLLFGAISLSAAALFWPFLCSIYLSNVTPGTYGIAVLAGGGSCIALWYFANMTIPQSAASGMVAGLIVVGFGWLVPRLLKKKFDEPHVQHLRMPEIG